MKKRVFSALLALVLTLSAVVLPASAAGSFSDVSDKKTAQNVEVLRLLGVVEGNRSNVVNKPISWRAGQPAALRKGSSAADRLLRRLG